VASRVPQRNEVPVQYTWDTASIFPSDQAWEAEIELVGQQLSELAGFRGRLSDGPAILADWMEALQNMLRSLGKIHIYASNHHNVDTTDQASAAQNDRAMGLYARAMATVAFAEPELLAIDTETLFRWVREEPRLAIYAHYVDELGRRRPHVRSAEVEELLGQIMDPFHTATATHSVLADADLTFTPAHSSDREAEPIQVTQGNIDALLASPDRDARRTAWESYADAHLATKNTMANCLSTGVKQNVFRARARRYGSALEAALSANHIPQAVYYNVLDTFRQNLPTWHRYWRIRRQALGYDRLHVYDIKAPLTTRSPQVPFDWAVEQISEGLRPLGKDYLTTMRKGLLEQRWVDIYPNRGKRSGAFSTGAPGTHPFVLMSYTDDLESLSTLAHELGHSMHSYYTWQTQPVIYGDYSIFVAEVASNVNQALVRDHLLKANTDRDFQIAVIEEAMSNFHRYFFLMPTLARFELEIHQRVERGEALTADSMMALMTDLFREGYGEEVEIDEDRIGITWGQFHTHLYANFYVYQYTTGISGAHALARGMLAGTPGAVENYVAFLKTGNSLYPIDALNLAGVDLTTPKPVESAFAYLAGLVDRLEELLEQGGTQKGRKNE